MVMHSLAVKLKAIIHYKTFEPSLRRVAQVYGVSKCCLHARLSCLYIGGVREPLQILVVLVVWCSFLMLLHAQHAAQGSACAA